MPAIVLSTAITPLNASAPLVILWEPEHQTEQFYVYMHFTEIEELAKNQTREFNITLNGKSWFTNLSPQYQGVTTIRSKSGTSGKIIIFSLEMTENSTLPPIINAIEIYKVIEFQQADTYQGDGMTKRNTCVTPSTPHIYINKGIKIQILIKSIFKTFLNTNFSNG